MKKESTNKVELTGTVGKIKQTVVEGRPVLFFSLATHSLFNESAEAIVMETTWHNVTAFQNSTMPDLTQIEEGDTVHLFGRIRQRQVRSSEGAMGTTYDIIAHTLECSDAYGYRPENCNRY